MTRTGFVTKFWPLATEVGAEFGVSPVAILAHALKEAGASNARAAARHNYFGFMKAGKHLAYPDDRTGFRAYARRLTTKWPQAAAKSGDGREFAEYLAHSSYLHESDAHRVAYARTLASIYQSVARDVARLGLDAPPVAGVGATANVI